MVNNNLRFDFPFQICSITNRPSVEVVLGGAPKQSIPPLMLAGVSKNTNGSAQATPETRPVVTEHHKLQHWLDKEIDDLENLVDRNHEVLESRGVFSSDEVIHPSNEICMN